MVSLNAIIYLVAVVLLTITLLLVSHLLNPKAAKKQAEHTGSISEVSKTDTNNPWHINYFSVAVSFMIVDIEAVFLYVWAIVVMNAGWQGFLVTTACIGVLLLGLLLGFKQNPFGWHKKSLKA